MAERIIPIFPLKVVLFPRMLLPVHIFEQRYREMVQQCLDGDGRIGICLLAEGDEVGDEHAVPHPVGAIGQIGAVSRLADGQMNIILAGEERFKIAELFRDGPYLRASVVEYEDEDEAVDSRMSSEVRRLADDVCRRALGAERASAFTLPDENEALSFLLAMLLPLDMESRQQLLELQNTGERLGLELALLRHLQPGYEAEEENESPRGYEPFVPDARRFGLN